MDRGGWINEIDRVIHRLMIKTQDPMHLPLRRPLVGVNQIACLTTFL